MTDVYSYQGAETRLQRESQYGVTPSPPDFVRLDGLGVRMKPTIQKNRFRPPGAMIPTVGTLDDDFSTGSVEGIVDFNGLLFALAGRFGAPVTTNPAAGAYLHVWSWNGRRPLRPVSYLCHRGFPDSADVIPGMLFNSLNISGGRADGFEVSGDAFGKKMTTGQLMGGVTREVQTITASGTVTGGTYTITIVELGVTTAALAYNANAATVQAAIDLLPGVQDGDITVGGGPLPATPMTLTYGGPYLAGRNVAQATVDGALLTGTTPVYTPTTTTPGADAVTTIEAVPAGAVMADVWLDATWAGLGTTQLLHAYSMELGIPEGQMRVRPMNRSLSSDDIIDAAEQQLTLGLMLGINAVERARLAALRASDKEFVRVQWTGDQIAASGLDFMLRVDAAVDWDDPGDEEDVDSVWARMWNGVIMNDPTGDDAIEITLRNAISSLAP